MGADGHGGPLLDSYFADRPKDGKPQQGLSLLLGSLPGRHLGAFTAISQAPGPGARYRAGARISPAGEQAGIKVARPALCLPPSGIGLAAMHNPT